MTSPVQQDPKATSTGHREFSLERVSRLVADLEQELASAPAEMPNRQELRDEIAALRHVLASSNEKEAATEQLHALRTGLHNITAKVEGEVLRDSPYIAELGRILGMV